jgi:hypothetical protein
MSVSLVTVSDRSTRAWKAARGWPVALALPAAALVLTPAGWPLWAWMWTVAFAIYAGVKWLTWRRTPVAGARWWRHAGYLAAWPGLDAPRFLSADTRGDRPRAAEWAFAVAKLGLGIVAMFVLARLALPDYPLVAGWIGMAGIAFVLHFGAFHLLSCVWRSAGVDARPLMDWPVAAQGVSEFWGRRWNTAFRDLTHRFLFRPLAAWWGPRWALGMGFLFSGLVHDLVISVPAGGGYGGPTLFFALQGGAILVERGRWGRRMGLGSGVRGWLFTAAVLLVPAAMLFHPPFVHRVVLPFLRALEAVP